MKKRLLLSLLPVLVLTAQQRTAFEAVSIKVHPEPIYVSNSDTSGTIARWTASAQFADTSSSKAGP